MFKLDKNLLGPLVYLVYREEFLLYIGSSIDGIRRFKGHHVLTNALLMNDNIEIYTIFCKNEEECRKLEKDLQKRLDPLICGERVARKAVASYCETEEKKEQQRLYIKIFKTRDK